MGEHMEVYLLRHGQTVMNEQHTLQGQSNSDLNDVGIRQAQQVRRKIEESGLEFQRIYCSPLHRTVQTCRIATGKDEAEFILDDRLKEVALGDLEGVRFDSLDPALSEKFMRCPFDFVPLGNGETMQQVVDRAGAFMEELKQSENNDTVLVVSHGGTLHAILYYLLDKPQEAFLLPWIDNCALIHLQINSGKWMVEEQYRSVEIPEFISKII